MRPMKIGNTGSDLVDEQREDLEIYLSSGNIEML